MHQHPCCCPSSNFPLQERLQRSSLLNGLYGPGVKYQQCWYDHDCTTAAAFQPIPCRIVQRSSLLNGLYGPDFKYREAMAPGGLLGAAAMSGMMAGIGAMFALAPLRNLAKK